ncbi:IS66 family transposase [Heyndrickxia sporothermodurans]|uniref:IS66 family transposase n=1 Tax=Heyndrickxia sporothermodurans TaxID=46224 RepID=UPI0036D32BB9
MKVQHIEHAYECKDCKVDSSQPAQIKRGKAPQPAIQRSIASPSVLAKVIYDKFAQYLPLYRQVKEWNRYGLNTNDKNLSNWVIRVAHDWLLPVYERMKELMMAKSVCMSMKHTDKLSTDPMGNLVKPMRIIGCFEVCQARHTNNDSLSKRIISSSICP